MRRYLPDGIGFPKYVPTPEQKETEELVEKDSYWKRAEHAHKEKKRVFLSTQGVKSEQQLMLSNGFDPKEYHKTAKSNAYYGRKERHVCPHCGLEHTEQTYKSPFGGFICPRCRNKYDFPRIGFVHYTKVEVIGRTHEIENPDWIK